MQNLEMATLGWVDWALLQNYPREGFTSGIQAFT
jgi:hypothetical protein